MRQKSVIRILLFTDSQLMYVALLYRFYHFYCTEFNSTIESVCFSLIKNSKAFLFVLVAGVAPMTVKDSLLKKILIFSKIPSCTTLTYMTCIPSVNLFPDGVGTVVPCSRKRRTEFGLNVDYIQIPQSNRS